MVPFLQGGFLPELQQNFPSISSQAKEQAMNIHKCGPKESTTQGH